MRKILLFLFLLTTLAFACLWDRDTLAEEAKGRPGSLKIIVGWFDRYPPTYYQMRLERVSKELEAAPNDLGLYDDAAVACERLGRVDEAIGWMAKKKAVLDSLPESEAKEHRYRYLSNLGTFHLHRWILQPQAQRESDPGDLRQSEKLIAQAIEENPDAHFGREIYQLMAIRWLLWDGVSPIQEQDDTIFTHDETHWVATMRGPELGHIDGISGLIQLGLAWESPDAFRTLAVALDSNELSSIAELAYQRESELNAAGKGSLHPVAEVRETIPLISMGKSRFLLEKDRQSVRDYYPIARAAADRRNAAWVAYQEARFAKGMHPDTHPDFWNSWTEPDFPEPPGTSLLDQWGHISGAKMILGVALVFMVGAIILKVALDLARRKSRATESR